MKDVIRKVIKANENKFHQKYYDNHLNISHSFDVIHRYIKRFEYKCNSLYTYKSIRIGLSGDDFVNNKVSIVIDFECKYETGGITIKTLG